MLARRGTWLVLLVLCVASRAAEAQRRPVLDIAPPTLMAPGAAATVTATNLFADAEMRDLVRSGFPASLHFRLELWRIGGLFNDLEGQQEWQIIVQYDPSTKRYRVVRQQNGRMEDLGSYGTLSSAQAVIESQARVTLVPEREGTRYYYALTLIIEALSVSDMDQLERWLRGTRSGTAVSAVSNGMRTLMLRMLGGEKRNFTAKSVVFVAGR